MVGLTDRDPPARSLAATIEHLAEPNVLSPCRTDGLFLYTWDLPDHHRTLVYRPSLCVVARGEKSAAIGDAVHRYDPAHYFFTAVPLPARLDVKREAGGRVSGLVLELDLDLVARVSQEIDEVRHEPEGDHPEASTFVAALGHPLADALTRLVLLSQDELKHRLLHRSLLREIALELLTGPRGLELRAALRQRSALLTLTTAIRHMEAHYAETLRVAELARLAGMSQSLFFAKFRQLTGTTPLQYLKALRLTQARAMLVDRAVSVTEVAQAVGYSSAAQFSRDFRRFCGVPPSSLRDATST